MRYLLVLLCACGGGVKYNASTTKGVGCDDAANAFCTRLAECSVINFSERGACLSGFRSGCCGDNGSCGRPILNPTGAAECVNRLPVEKCDAFGTLNMPSLPAYCGQMF